MDPLQQKALNALEPFILLSKSATSPRAAIDLITQATTAPNTYVFAELLQTPNIQALRTAASEHSKHYTLLEIFCWGTWKDYESINDLPELSEAQSHKLRLLTLLTLAPTPTSLSYPSLQHSLSLPTPRALEDLLIAAIYASLLTGTLSPRQGRVDITSLSPLRDVKPGSVPGMVAVLEEWDGRCVAVLAELEERVRAVRKKAGQRRRGEEMYDGAREMAMEQGENGVKREEEGRRGKRGLGLGAVGGGVKRGR